jgi:hypothetical protein
MITTTETRTLVTVFYLPERDNNLARHDGNTKAIASLSLCQGWNSDNGRYDFLMLLPGINQNVDSARFESTLTMPSAAKYQSQGVLVSYPQKDYAEDNLARTYALADAKELINFVSDRALLTRWRDNTTNTTIVKALSERVANLERGML